LRTTTFKCDRCGAESVGDDTIDLLRVAVGVGQYFSDYSQRDSSEWCRKCRIETGIEQPNKNTPEIIPIDPLPTLEEMVRAIVREEIQNQ
jgi:hypothetical protein